MERGLYSGGIHSRSARPRFPFTIINGKILTEGKPVEKLLSEWAEENKKEEAMLETLNPAEREDYNQLLDKKGKIEENYRNKEFDRISLNFVLDMTAEELDGFYDIVRKLRNYRQITKERYEKGI